MLASRFAASRLVLRVPTRAFSSSPQQPPARTQKDIGDGIKEEGMTSDVEGYKPLYATKSTYDKKVVTDRHRSADAESGHRPTAMQRRFLVLTKLYKNQSEIPEIVANGTMNRMHDRMRVVFIIVGIFGFFIIFFIGESVTARRIARDRDSGVVVTKM